MIPQEISTKFSKIIILCLFCVLIAGCGGPTTYVFIGPDSGPNFDPTPTPSPSVNPTDTPDPAVPTSIPTAPSLLSATSHVDPICNDNGRLLEVKVNLKVSGGIPPYTLEGKEINPSKPVLSLRAGQVKEFVIKSSDGQSLPIRIQAPTSCDNTKPGDVVNPPIYGCTDPIATNYNPSATIDNGSCAYPPIPGCTDPIATNYNPSATKDDGSCTYVLGCMDPAATNYNPLATRDDGSCTYPVRGCTDPVATNYNPLATVDDGSCRYVLGCTDQAATNYNPLATRDDGSCSYQGRACNNGNDDDNDGFIDGADPQCRNNGDDDESQ